MPYWFLSLLSFGDDPGRPDDKKTYKRMNMKKTLIIAAGIIGAYMACVGIYDTWNFLEGQNPSETVRRLACFFCLFPGFSFLTWFILEGMFDMD